MKLFKGILLVLIITVQCVMAQETTTKSARTGENQSAFVNHFTRAYLLAMKYGDYNQAINAVYNVMAEFPKNDSLKYSLAYLYYQAKNIPSSVLAASELLKTNPGHIGALEIVGNGYESLGLKDKSLDAYETLYLKTNDYQTLYKVAFLQFDLQRYSECNTNLDILLKKPESDSLMVYYTTADNKEKEYSIKVSLLNMKGLVGKAKGDKVNAKKYFEQALVIAPDFELAKDNLATLDSK